MQHVACRLATKVAKTTSTAQTVFHPDDQGEHSAIQINASSATQTNSVR
jgi:ribosomal protein L13